MRGTVICVIKIVDNAEMPHLAAFHLVLHCLLKYAYASKQRVMVDNYTFRFQKG